MSLRQRNWSVYEQGKLAFYAGKAAEDCPYVGRGVMPNESDKRLDWMNGYYQAKYGDKWESFDCTPNK